jgi:AcrR family transcriptional regulator
VGGTVSIKPPAARVRPRGFAGAQVTELQRNRLMAATVQMVDELGYARLTVASIIGRARVSRKTFYDIFCDREDCFLAVFERAVAGARELATRAAEAEPGWREGVREALRTLLAHMDEQPALARLCIVEALSAGEGVLEARCELLQALAEAIDLGRAT